MAGDVTEATRNAVRALLVRAADAEASRQRAVRDGDHVRAAALEAELRELWRAHADLEQRERIA